MEDRVDSGQYNKRMTNTTIQSLNFVYLVNNLFRHHNMILFIYMYTAPVHIALRTQKIEQSQYENPFAWGYPA